ncbi:hypothetical protein [Fusibacillus kribbianus]|uniref:Uracil-DNA glycosylase-like domain-containing protein n=1 Tax=Fusibacillus kribbianus TaxID=3044208 RepID=A0AAP4EZT5_9FIRM|nr:hypothetical protein [Ruminococcus sp. YH-rum2234]MDI9242260.1 hypothetical protein [Ruminococcus sp. YH-rum2234]
MNTFKNWEDKAIQAKTLKELFGYWKRAHETEENFGETLPKNPKDGKYPGDKEEYKNNFCWDGVTSINGRVCQEKIDPKVDVLFILKEANTDGKLNKSDKAFWFNDPDSGSSKRRDTYANRLKMILEKFSKEKSEEEIEKIPFGYMNLNKRGGFGSTDSKQLKNYVNKYKYFIKRQIELHDPQIVVFCGCFDGIADQLFNIESKWNGNFVYGNIGDKNVRLYYVYHPSCSRFKNSFEYLK